LENSKKNVKKTKTATKKLTYEEIEDIVEYLVKTKSHSYSFDCWSHEDIAQEIRIICFQKMESFDPSRVEKDKWKNFFGRCVDNALKNLRRDNYLRTPTIRIDLNSMSPEEIIEFKKTEDYSKWQKFQISLQRKLRIFHPVPIDILGDTIKHCKFHEELEYKDLEKYVVDSAPFKIRGYLVLMLDGKGNLVSQSNKRKVQSFIKKILD